MPLTPEELLELEQRRELNELREEQGDLDDNADAPAIKVKQPTVSELYRERAAQLNQTASDIEAAVEGELKKISISYADRLITVAPTTPELAKLYDAGLTRIATSLRKEASMIEEEAAREEQKEQTIADEGIAKEQLVIGNENTTV